MPPRPAYLDRLYGDRGEIQSLIKIRNSRGVVVPFKFNAAQVDYAAKATTRDIILKRRRLGFSTLKLAEGLARAAFLGHRCGIISHNRDLTEQFLAVVGQMYDSIPDQFRPPVDRRNTKALAFTNLGGSLAIGTARMDIFGRGDTFQFIHWSEVAHSPTPTDREIWLGISEAAKDGDISWESTANGEAGLFYDQVDAVYSGLSDRWALHFYPWWWGEDTRVPAEWPDLGSLSVEEREMRDKYGLGPDRIMWMRQKKAEIGPKFAQEYPKSVPEAFIASGAHYFDPVMMLTLKEQAQRVREIREDGLHVWELPTSMGAYAIGGDTGGGGESYVDEDGSEESDFSAASIINVRTGRVVATFRQRIRPDAFAELLMRWGREYHDAFLAVERNREGAQVNKILIERGYHSVYMERTSEQKWVYGWFTAAQSRYTLLATLEEAIRTGAITIDDPRFYDETRNFTAKVDTLGRTKYAAPPGKPDDLIFATAIGWFTRDKAPTGVSAKPVLRSGRWG